MGKNGWKQFFSTTILQRGHDYFERGLVENLHCDGGEVTAEVWGSEQYDVEILMNDSKVVEWKN